MAAKAKDLANIVLILGNFVGTPNILELSENSRYEFTPSGDLGDDPSWKGGQAEVLAAPLFCFEFGENMYSPQGWVLGSSDDTDRCDLQIAENNETGISGQHFRIDISPVRRCPRLTVMSTNPIRIRDGLRMVTLRRGEDFEISLPVTIDMGRSSLQAWCPILSTTEQRLYCQNAEKFSREFLDALPRHLPIELNAPGASTFNLRFGNNNTVYVEDRKRLSSKGSAGSVMMVRESKSGKVFAAKELWFKATDSASERRKRWEALTGEYQKIVQLKHVSHLFGVSALTPSTDSSFFQPNIVQAIDVLVSGKDNEPPWMIMEWIERSLDSIHLDGRYALTVLTQVSSGLSYMHSCGFTHRDLKPANILIQMDENGLTAKIADLGVTKQDISGNMKSYVGTRLYMAPEFWNRKQAYTNAVDMWSFGLIVAEYLTNWDPRSDLTWTSAPPSTLDEHRDWIHEVLLVDVAAAPTKFKPLLEGLLHETPEERWAAIKCLEWLRKNAQADGGIEAGTSRSRKRPAAALNQDSTGCDGPDEENLRCQRPTLTTPRQ
jgi:serine/threonine protein kinase